MTETPTPDELRYAADRLRSSFGYEEPTLDRVAAWLREQAEPHTPDAATTEYVVGFALDGEHVALIEKNRPAWQAGRLNGIGGHVESGEVPLDAMRREFHEETGVAVGNWDLFVVMEFHGARIHCYRARVCTTVLWSLESVTDERVTVQTIGMPDPDWWLPNLLWLVPLAACTADVYEPIHVQAAMAEALS